MCRKNPRGHVCIEGQCYKCCSYYVLHAWAVWATIPCNQQMSKLSKPNYTLCALADCCPKHQGWTSCPPVGSGAGAHIICICRVGQNRIYTPYIWRLQHRIGQIYCVYILFVPTLRICLSLWGVRTCGVCVCICQGVQECCVVFVCMSV